MNAGEAKKLLDIIDERSLVLGEIESCIAKVVSLATEVEQLNAQFARECGRPFSDVRCAALVAPDRIAEALRDRLRDGLAGRTTTSLSAKARLDREALCVWLRDRFAIWRVALPDFLRVAEPSKPAPPRPIGAPPRKPVPAHKIEVPGEGVFSHD